MESGARSVLAEYETSDTTTAYVDPTDPDDAFLTDRTTNASLLATGIGLFSVLVGAGPR